MRVVSFRAYHSECIAQVTTAFQSFVSFYLAEVNYKLCRISLVAVFFASGPEDITLLPDGIKLEQFFFCSTYSFFLSAREMNIRL